MNKTAIRAVIFDWAGTTVDFGSCAPVLALTRAFADLGVTVGETDVRAYMGLAKRDHIARLLVLPQIRSAWKERTGTLPNEQDIDKLAEKFEPHLATAAAERSELVPGLLAAVEALRSRGILIGSSTGYSRGMLTPILEAARRQGYEPDCVVTPEDVPAGRPAPYMIWRNATELGVYPLSAIAKVGDTPADMEEGRKASVWTIGVASSSNEAGLSLAAFNRLEELERQRICEAVRARLLHAGAHYVMDSLSELATLVDELGAEKPERL